jgi:hypothetical protein
MTSIKTTCGGAGNNATGSTSGSTTSPPLNLNLVLGETTNNLGATATTNNNNNTVAGGNANAALSNVKSLWPSSSAGSQQQQQQQQQNAAAADEGRVFLPAELMYCEVTKLLSKAKAHYMIVITQHLYLQFSLGLRYFRSTRSYLV